MSQPIPMPPPYPLPDPPIRPPYAVPSMQVGTATYAMDRCCQYCGGPAEVFDVDGSWCTPEHQRFDRQSEITIWRNAVGAR